MPVTKQRGEPSWLAITLVLMLALGGAGYYVMTGRPSPEQMIKVPERKPATPAANATTSAAAPSFEKFADAKEFRAWLAESGETTSAVAPVSKELKTEDDATRPGKLKAAGNNLFFATSPTGRKQAAAVRLVKAWPIDNLALAASLEENGDLVAVGETLVVATANGLQAYDVTDMNKPVKTWRYAYGDGQTLHSTQTVGTETVLVVESLIDRQNPCPLKPLLSEGSVVEVPCDAVWHPGRPGGETAALSVIALETTTGKVTRTAAVVGERYGLEMAIAAGGLYAAAALPSDELATAVAFAKESAPDVPEEVTRELEKIQSYDLTPAARTLQVDAVIGNWLNAMTEEERAMTQGLLAGRLASFWSASGREMEKSALLSLDFRTFTLKATGTVPGVVPTASAMKVQDDGLAVYTAISGEASVPKGLRLTRTGTQGDLYVLDGSLKPVSNLMEVPRGQGLGTVRFMSGKAFIASTAETDGVTVVDLLSEGGPTISGKLALPGAASYLHRISDTRLIGVGKEGSQVKISLFDIGGREPKEMARYALDEYWTDVEGTHAAFTLDAERQALFLPASRGGYVMSFEGDTLGIVTPVNGLRVSRSAFANGLLYLAGEDKLTVVSTTTWKRTMQVTWPLGR
jgi:uncharacterized secreted protein with C-terminal beta-propeller domain